MALLPVALIASVELPEVDEATFDQVVPSVARRCRYKSKSAAAGVAIDSTAAPG
ncbi:MAG: hypothetical protein ACT6T0_07410 [Nevskia sp.]|uniref:hypothetical protein n=1 Tax=Nevskia sp. TaxID=1929292 RepID=UPI00403531E4